MKSDDYNKTITATELKTNLGKYLDYVIDDHELVVTKNGKKEIRISPYITDLEKYYTVKENALDYQYGGMKVSYEEFMEIYEKSDLRMEFINGEIILLSSPNIYHQDICSNLHLIFKTFLKGKKCKVYFAPFDVIFYKKDIKEPDVMQPDLLIACDVDDMTNEKGHYTGTPSLVVEVLSKSTRSRDMVDKLNTYMLSGVKEFWVIDPNRRNVLVYSFKDFAIDEFCSYKNNDLIKSGFLEGLDVDINEIFSMWHING